MATDGEMKTYGGAVDVSSSHDPVNVLPCIILSLMTPSKYHSFY